MNELNMLLIADVLILILLWVDILLGRDRWGIFWLTCSFMANMLVMCGAIYGKRR